MRRILAILLIGIFVFCEAASADLIGSYSFDGNALDSSGNDLTGTVYGATLASDRFGNANSAYSFDGVDDYIALPNAALLHPSQYTISAWLYQDAATTGGTIFADYHWNGTPLGTSFFPHGTWLYVEANKKIGASIRSYPDGGDGSSINTLADGSWNHIAAVYDGLTFNMYLNGDLEFSFSGPNTPGTTTPIIGKASWYPGSYYSGVIDDFQIYNNALSVSEVRALSGAPVPEPATMLLLGTGLIGLAGTRRKFRK